MDYARFKENGVSEWFSDVIGRGRVFGCNVQFTRLAHNGGRDDLVEKGGVTEGKLYRIPVAVLEGYLYGREGAQSKGLPTGCHSGYWGTIIVLWMRLRLSSWIRKRN